MRQLILESQTTFDSFVLALTDKATGKESTVVLNDYIPEHRDRAISFMAEAVAFLLVSSFFVRMTELLQDEFEDHKMLGKAVLAEWMVTCFESDEHIHNKLDVRTDVDQAVSRIADRKRTTLRQRLKGLPNIVAERGRGGAYNVKHNWTPEELDCLAKNYAELQPVWSDAKQIARAAQKSKVPARVNNWRAEVLRAYPDLPSDLLERFVSLRSDDAKPSDIAIIHAKMKCGVRETYTPRELRDKIRTRKLKTQD